MVVEEGKDIPQDNEVVSVAQAAETLNVSKMTIYRWIESKIIASREVAGLVCIPQKEIERLKTERAPAEATEAPTSKNRGEQ
jgi:excisionase family DNA binding protein